MEIGQEDPLEFDAGLLRFSALTEKNTRASTPIPKPMVMIPLDMIPLDMVFGKLAKELEELDSQVRPVGEKLFNKVIIILNSVTPASNL